jgi:hypothetical protein
MKKKTFDCVKMKWDIQKILLKDRNIEFPYLLSDIKDPILKNLVLKITK